MNGITPYGIRAYISPTIYTSTTVDNATFTSTVYGDAYAVTLECLSGNLSFSPTGVSASTAVGIKIPAGQSWTILMKKTSANPNAVLSFIALSTADIYQAAIHG